MFEMSIEAVSKDSLVEKVKIELSKLGFRIVSEDLSRPWGAFLVIDPAQIKEFKHLFFKEVNLEFLNKLSFSPKILMVAPNQKLSWQYHHRRSELWKLVAGEAAIARSLTDEEKIPENMVLGEVVKLSQGERHRLIGLEKWGVVAEIWVHTDPTNPSDESDIVRLQDDYSRA